MEIFGCNENCDKDDESGCGIRRREVCVKVAEDIDSLRRAY